MCSLNVWNIICLQRKQGSCLEWDDLNHHCSFVSLPRKWFRLVKACAVVKEDLLIVILIKKISSSALSNRPIITCKQVLDKGISVLQADLYCPEILPWGKSQLIQRQHLFSSSRLLRLLPSSAVSNTVPPEMKEMWKGVYDWNPQILCSSLTRIAFPWTL